MKTHKWHKSYERPKNGERVIALVHKGDGSLIEVVAYHSGYEWCDDNDKNIQITHYDKVIAWRENDNNEVREASAEELSLLFKQFGINF